MCSQYSFIPSGTIHPMYKSIIFIIILSMPTVLPTTNSMLFDTEDLVTGGLNTDISVDRTIETADLAPSQNNLINEVSSANEGTFKEKTIKLDDPARQNSVQYPPDTSVLDQMGEITPTGDLGTSEIETTSFTDPYLEYDGRLNVTTTTKIEETDVNGIRITLNVTAHGKVNVTELPIDYVLILDSSGSVGELGWNNTIKWASDFVQSLKDNDRVAIIRFATGANLTHSLNDNQDRAFIVDKLNNTGWTQGYTFTRDAIELAIDEFVTNSTSSTPKFIFMVTDGVPTPTQQEPCRPPYLRPELDQNGIRAFILGIRPNWNRNLLRCLVQDPNRDLISIQTYDQLNFNPEDLSEILQSLINQTASNINLELMFNPDLILDSYSEIPSGIMGNNLNFTRFQLKENDSWIITLDFGVPGLGYIDVLLGGSTLSFLPVNGTQTSVDLDPLGIEVLLFDDTPPVVYVPTDLTVEASGSGGTVVAIAAFAIDNVDGYLTATCDPPSGSEFPLGDTLVICSATDANGNIGSAVFVISVVDTTPPVIDTPGDITVEAESSSGTAVEFAISAFDIVDGEIAVSCIPSSGSIFLLGDTIVNCESVDNNGNLATSSFHMIVEDTTSPVIVGPEDSMVLLDLGVNHMNWTLTDYYPNRYTLFLNGSSVDDGFWTSGNVITYNYDGLTSGVYNFTMFATDTSANSATYQTILTVISVLDELECLRQSILDLGLNHGNTQALLVKLDKAIKYFSEGKYQKSIDKLLQLSHLLSKYIKCGKVSDADLVILTGKIDVIIEHIQLYQDLNDDHDCPSHHWHHREGHKHTDHHKHKNKC